MTQQTPSSPNAPSDPHNAASHTGEEVRPGPNNDLTDVPHIRVGQAHDATIKTGVSVVIPEQPMVCGVDVRGGGPGTRETDLLTAHTLVDRVDALVLAGGSTYGLAAADAVGACLGAAGKGFALVARAGVPRSPIVPAAILYDLANGGQKDWGQEPPYYRLGQQAYEAAMADLSPPDTQNPAVAIAQGKAIDQGKAIHQGKAGAGFGALAGQEPGGIGSCSIVTPDGLIIGALMAVNSFGSVRMPRKHGADSCPYFWAAPYEMNDEFGGHGWPADMTVAGFPNDTKLGPFGGSYSNDAHSNDVGPRENTTIGVVAVSQPLSQADATRIAIMAQDGFARSIRPVHAPTDGDVVFVLAPKHPDITPVTDPVTLTRLGTYAADCVARAIAKGVYKAASP